MLAVFGTAAELQPGVAEPLVIPPAKEEVPLIFLSRSPSGSTRGRREVRVEQERQDEREHL